MAFPPAYMKPYVDEDDEDGPEDTSQAPHGGLLKDHLTPLSLPLFMFPV